MGYNIFNSLEATLIGLWASVVQFLPLLVVALLVLIVGLIVAGSLKRLTIRVFNTLRVDEALRATGFVALVERTGFSFSSGRFVGTLVKWFVMLVFLIVAMDILRLSEVTNFITYVVMSYFPRVIVATLILIAAALLAGLARNGAVAAATVAQVKYPAFFGKVAYVAILVFAGLAALNQLQIATELVQMLFGGLVFGLALAFGLAFGLGGRETAARVLDSVTKK